MSEVTKEEKLILLHTLGLPNPSKLSYRNHYVAGKDHHSWELLQSLVDKGLMGGGEREIDYLGYDRVFYVKRAGIDYVQKDYPFEFIRE
jgi:hypothetical protein